VTETNEPVPPTSPAAAPPPFEAAPAPFDAAPASFDAAPTAAAAPAYAAPATPAAYGQQAGGAPIGKVRSTGTCILLAIVTLGIYTWVWYFKTHEEMKRHSGQGIGGGIALVLALFVSIVMPYITSAEVGGLYERRGQEKPVSGATGLWNFPGAFILVGPIVWFVKTNGALNDYWRSVGAQG
jgi:hypothetical protein